MSWFAGAGGATPGWKELVEAAKASKGLYVGLAAVVALLANQFLAPHEDDLAFSVKALVVVLLAAGGFLFPAWFTDLGAPIGWLAGAALLAALAYGCVYWAWGIRKTVAVPARLFRRGSYKSVSVLGGLALRPEAREAMRRGHRSEQDFFADCGFRQEDVWQRWSLVAVRSMAFLSYVAGLAAMGLVLLLVVRSR